jgi:hypothetical protein
LQEAITCASPRKVRVITGNLVFRLNEQKLFILFQAVTYIVFAGLGLPQRIAIIQQKVMEFDESKQEKDEVSASLSSFTRVKKKIS